MHWRCRRVPNPDRVRCEVLLHPRRLSLSANTILQSLLDVLVPDPAAHDPLLFYRLTVSMRISEENFTMTWKTFEFMFFNVHNLILWTLPLGLAILLRVVTHKYHHQLIFPLCEFRQSFDAVPGIVLTNPSQTTFSPCRFYHYSCYLLYCCTCSWIGPQQLASFRMGVRYGVIVE